MTDTPALPGDPPRRATRRRIERESPDMEAMVRRVLAALVRRAGAGDLTALESLARLELAAREATVAAGRAAHEGPAAYSFTELGLALGITRQSARERFG